MRVLHAGFKLVGACQQLQRSSNGGAPFSLHPSCFGLLLIATDGDGPLVQLILRARLCLPHILHKRPTSRHGDGGANMQQLPRSIMLSDARRAIRLRRLVDHGERVPNFIELWSESTISTNLNKAIWQGGMKHVSSIYGRRFRIIRSPLRIR